MLRRLAFAAALVLFVPLLVAGSSMFPSPPEAASAGSGDVVSGAEAAGVDATEWEALMRGSETALGAAAGKGGLQALLESGHVDFVVFYLNRNRSLSLDEDDAYHVYARRCGDRVILAEECAEADIVFDHLRFQRFAEPNGRYRHEILSLSAENPVGTVLPIAAVNPFGAPHGPGPVLLADRDDARRDPRALADFASEVAAGSQSVDETGLPTVGVVRDLIAPENTRYAYPYERLAAVLDDSDAPDLYYVPTPSGSSPRGTHGAASITQSRSTLLVSGRAARRTPLDPAEEATFEIHNVDVAPTVARVLGISENTAAQYLNDGDAAANPAAPPALLRRQDGKPVDGLLEARVNTFVIAIDGMLPENINALDTPNLCNLIDCPGAAAPDASARATVYEQARAVMISQTNANHAAMMTGAYGERNGIVANAYWNRATGVEQATDEPQLIRVDTLFDVLRRDLPHLKTAAVMGKEKLRQLFDCTNDGNGQCIAGDANNPEGVAVTHVRPDFLRGAATTPAPGSDDCPAEGASGSGVALDACVMDIVIELSATEDPDFTFVNLGNVDALQHVDGPNSPAADAAVGQADLQIGRLVAYLKESGKWQGSVLFVVADHSFSYQGAPPAQRISLASALAPCTGESFQVVAGGGAAQVSLDSIAVGTASLDASQQAALQCLRATALAQPGVSEAWYRIENPLDPGKTVAANRPDWHLDDQRVGDLLVSALASGPTAGPANPLAPGGNAFEVSSGPGYSLASPASASGALPGDHGHPGARAIPFAVIGGGDHVIDQDVAALGAVNEGDDTAANPGQAENVDIAPTIAWIYGLDPTTALPDAQGRVLTEAFGGIAPIDSVEPHANRAIILMFDGNNSVRIHELMADCDDAACGNAANEPVPAVRSLLMRPTDARADVSAGTLTSFGSISAMPTVTFPNHNVVGSGVYPGHHGIVGNNYYERDIETERDPIDPVDPRNPVFFFSSALLRADFETLHEAVHRSFGDWSPANPTGAFTASVNEPSARGADFASLETVSSENLPATFAALVADAPEFVEDTTLDPCAEDSPGGYGQESVLDHLGQAQARALFSEPITNPSRPAGVDPLLIDDTGGAPHPDPKYMIENFTLTDGAGHEFGPHGQCTRHAYRDTSSRLGRVLEELANHERFATQGEPARLGETFIVLTGDHGMENQDLRPGENGGFDEGLSAADIEYVRQSSFVYLLTMDVAIEGPALIVGRPATLLFRVTDADLRSDGSATPIEGAHVSVESGSGAAAGITDANGEVILSFKPASRSARVVVDKDTSPSAGGRTTGSTSNDPNQHGLVAKSAYNDRVIELAVGPWAGCGLGFELVLGAPLLAAALRRRRR